MSNELLLAISALCDVAVVFVAAQFGERYLYGTIAANLILVSVFGIKLISVFGFVTNAGNIFYACVFLAAQFLLVHKSKNEVRSTIYFGAIVAIFFIAMEQFVVHLTSANPTDEASRAIQTLFTLTPRIALASVIAYVFAQYLNIEAFSWVKMRTHGNQLWLESTFATILSQFVDSCLFFTIAFIDLPGNVLVESILIGTTLKIVVGVLGTPLLYVDRYLKSR